MNKIHTVSVLSDSYTFTGASRDATINVSADTALPMRITSRSTGDSTVKFSPGVPLRFCRARLLSSGASLLSIPLGNVAAKLSLVVSGDTTDYSVTRDLSMVRWNEWEDKLVSFGCLPECDTYSLYVGSGSELRLDDFNISQAFLGEGMTPILELEWDNGAFYVPDTDTIVRV